MDLLPGLSTFFVCLFYRLEIGIAVGVLIQIFFVLYKVARPRVEVEEINVSCTYFTFKNCTKNYMEGP